MHCLPSQEIVCLLRSLSSNSRNPTVTKPEFVLNTLKYLASIMRVVVLDRDITLNGQVANALATILPTNEPTVPPWARGRRCRCFGGCRRDGRSR